MPVSAEFPDNLSVLFEPRRYKILYGGRGAGRSWGVARALLIIGTQRAIRVLCCRELQKSISESVHKVLSDQIAALGLEAFYEIQVAQIIGKNGTTFRFEGIKNNATAIKSYEGIDYCWVEEGNKVSKTSWGILIPTIRKETPTDWRKRGMLKPEFQAEIWVTFNPELDTDYTYARFVKNPALRAVSHAGSTLGSTWVSMESEDSVVVKMTHEDNPFFPEVLRSEMEQERARDYDNYLNVWEGHTLLQLEGTVYRKELRALREQGRIRRVPYEPEVPVDCFWDLGRGNHTCIWFGQFVAFEFRVLGFLDGQGEDITFYLKELQNRSYVYGTMFLPHDAKHKKLVYKHSIESIVRSKYPDTRVLPKTGLSDGINMARMFFPKCYFDELECADGLSAMARYKYKVVEGQITSDPLHDDGGACDAADAFRYMAQAASMPRTKQSLLSRLGLPPSARTEHKGREFAEAKRASSGLGWMR